MKEVTLYTDGACRGNPGPGGWGAILVYRDKEKVMSGGDRQTTNNRMEIMALLEGLKVLKEPCIVHLVSDSQYVCQALSDGWLDAWEKSDYRRGHKNEVKNIDLWEQIAILRRTHQIDTTWVKGHAGHPYNERCDSLATTYADSFIPARI